LVTVVAPAAPSASRESKHPAGRQLPDIAAAAARYHRYGGLTAGTAPGGGGQLQVGKAKAKAKIDAAGDDAAGPRGPAPASQHAQHSTYMYTY
jgi:hypothetical protein